MPKLTTTARVDGFACTALTKDELLAKRMKWARAIARGVRQHYRFQTASQEEQDLECVAYITLVRLIPKFDASRVPPGGDPEGQFRGWAHPFIRGECQREAKRLRNGGTYWTRRESGRQQVMVEELPHRRGDDGSEYVDLPDHRHVEDEPGIETLSDKLASILERLELRERCVLTLLYGIGIPYPHTRRELADALCLTVEQIAEIEQAALARARDLLTIRQQPRPNSPPASTA